MMDINKYIFSKTASVALLLSALFVSSVFLSETAFASAAKPKKSKKPASPKIQKAVMPSFEHDFQKYCFNNADVVGDAKFAWQAKSIAEMEGKLQKVIARLEVKQKEYQSWVTRREEFISKMTTSLVKIYSTMDPEAAAAQIAIVDYETAVSILTKLKPREASAILNEMDPKRASQLVKVIVGSIANDNKKETN